MDEGSKKDDERAVCVLGRADERCSPLLSVYTIDYLRGKQEKNQLAELLSVPMAKE